MLDGLLNGVASRVDSAVTQVIVRGHRWARRVEDLPPDDPERLGPEERIERLEAMAPLYSDARLLSEPDLFFPPGRPEHLEQEELGRFLGVGRCVDWTWESHHGCVTPGLADTWGACAQNRKAAARLFLHGDRPRPTAILVHGYLGGSWAFETRVWPIPWLFRAGLDVALAVLPHHGVRAPAGHRGAPAFPGSDPRHTVEGFRQAIGDVRALLELLQTEMRSPAVGVMGMSLGGYTAALLATVEERLAFCVPLIPLADLPDAIRLQGRFNGTPVQMAAQEAAMRRVLVPVSPLSRRSRVAPERVRVVAAEGDGITPLEHGRAIASHMGAELKTFVGGHLLQFGRAEPWREVGRMLGGLGLLEPRH
jgi:pimeloyl-ACP methyl ester carboxylesterase